MSVPLAVLQHEPETGLGALADLLDQVGVDRELLTTNAAMSLPDAGSRDGVIALAGSLGAHEPVLLETRRPD